ncbi:MAG: PKD domain-containing protein, partial [Gilvibacter sp.]
MKKLLPLLILLFSFGWSQAQDINMQNGTFFLCTGTLYDSGGPTGAYSSDETIIMTLCSDTPGIGIELDFTFFSTEAVNDVLTIYDGPDTTFPVIGDYSGTTGPGFVAATGPSGCLTLEFNSNFVINGPGFEADISCCQVITANFDSSTPPAAADGTINADVAEVITFNGSATFSLDGTGATYLWDFGDGMTGAGPTVMHSYAAAGAYDVTLTVTDATGCTNNNDIDVTALIGFGGADPGNLYVNAGVDVTLDCSTGGSVTLEADFQEIFETFSTSYTISPIVFSPPFPFNGLSTTLPVTADDEYSAVETFPFDFCFFGELEPQFQVGSNGVIRFEVGADGDFNAWDMDPAGDLPNNADEALAFNNIFTPGHDIDPSASASDFEMGYEVLGTYPNRALVVSYYRVANFSCNDLFNTHMAVIYEFSNIIDIYIQEKSICDTWNAGNAVVGIQNNEGTIAYVPPGRNVNDPNWATTDEAWRFAPDGAPSYVFEWLDDTGAVVGLSPILTVSPAVTTTYTARVTYTNTCNGDVVVLEDDVVVTVDSPFRPDLGPDITVCDGGPVLLDAEILVPPGLSYQWYQDAVILPGETMPTYSATVSGTYTVEVSDGSCTISDDIAVVIGTTPVPGTPDPLEICDDIPIDGFAPFTLTDADAQIIAGATGVTVTYYETLALADAGLPADALVSPYTNTSDPQTVYARLEEDASGCYATVELVLDVLEEPAINDPIADYEICDDASDDGVELFDLTTWNGMVSPAPAGLIFTYHETAADAAAGTLPIVPDTAYSNTSNPQTVYVRVESVDGCFNVGEFDLVVLPQPRYFDPEPYRLCDDGVADGFTEFDLTVKIPEITGGAGDISVSFHLTLADADAGAPALPALYTNVMNPQTVYVRVESVTTGCYATTTLELEVLDAPAAVTPTPLEYCDPDNDGFG